MVQGLLSISCNLKYIKSLNRTMMFLYILVCFLYTTTSAEEILAVAALKPSLLTSSDEPTCIKTTGDIEFWVNMAANARGITRMVATGTMAINTLTVDGATILGRVGGGEFADITNIRGNLIVTGTTTLSDTVLFNKFIYVDGREGDVTGRRPTELADTIRELENRIRVLELLH